MDRNNDKESNSDQYRKTDDVLISARNLYKSYDNSGSSIIILQGVDFNINKGETIAVIGASGIGKSTFLHIMGTLDRPDSGALLFRGKDVLLFNDTDLAAFRNKSVGFVFQFHHLLAEFTAIENVMMPALINGLDKKTATRLAEDILLRVGLKERLFHMSSKLSGGEQQRVALARALVLKPEILLADEPTGNLDRKNSELIHSMLMELNRELQMALVVVTHNSELASFMSRVVSIADGKLSEKA
ncbi:MAG: ABC transporter ATP-binding protein [Deltaproteobacteria bacterium]|nr:ABC transporter ATP-binding protein [Deltaproteobacteria bacterium]